MSFSKTVLVIEDEPDLRITLEYFLGKIGYQVLAAETGEKGLEIAREELPRVVLCDVQLPGMQGYEVCRKLKTDPLTRSIPVIFVSSKPRGELETEGGKVGADFYISKPVDPKDIGADLYFLFELDFEVTPDHSRNLRVSRPIGARPSSAREGTPTGAFFQTPSSQDPDPFADDCFPPAATQPLGSAGVEQAPARGSTQGSSADRTHRKILALCESQKSLLAQGGDFRKALEQSVQELEELLSDLEKIRSGHR